MAKVMISVMAISKKPSVVEPGGGIGVESRQLKIGIEGEGLVSKNGRNFVREFLPSILLFEYFYCPEGTRATVVYLLLLVLRKLLFSLSYCFICFLASDYLHLSDRWVVFS